MEGQRILVTGGAGLIGAALCEKLLALGHTVVCLDLPGRVLPPPLEKHAGDPNLMLVHHDMTVPFDMPADRIYALASPTSRKYLRGRPASAMRDMLRIAVNTIETALHSHAPVVVASAAAAYGNTRNPIQSEDNFGSVDTFGARSADEEGKRACEALCASYARQSGLDVRVARIFNTYGDWAAADDERVVPKFIRAALENRDIPILGNGEQTRSFCHADDTAEGLMALMALEPGAADAPVNLGHSYETTVSALAAKIRMLAGSTSRVVHLPASPNEIRNRCPDIARARELTGWMPRIPLDEGLRRAVDAFRRDASGNGRNARISWAEMI